MLRTTLTTTAALLALTAFPSPPLAAQDADSHPILGVWSLDREQSSYQPGPGPQGIRRHFRMDDDGHIVSVRITVAPNGTPNFAMSRFKIGGGDYPVWTNGHVNAAMSGETVSSGTASFEASDEWTLRLTQKNPQGAVNPLSPNTWAVSADGSTLTVTSTGTNANGVEVHNVEVYRRVEN
jgi:hypothetical protein